jgi:hypothetical protein
MKPHLLEPLAHIVPEAPGVRLVLEAHDNVISITREDHVARGLVPLPAITHPREPAGCCRPTIRLTSLHRPAEAENGVERRTVRSIAANLIVLVRFHHAARHSAYANTISENRRVANGNG